MPLSHATAMDFMKSEQATYEAQAPRDGDDPGG
jgi:hypothetical protein